MGHRLISTFILEFLYQANLSGGHFMDVKSESYRILSSLRGDYIDNMFYLLTQGGMMQISYASLFDK